MNTSLRQETHPRKTGILLFGVFLLLVMLYCYVAYTSFGYDDEYYNIRVVGNNTLGDLVKLVQTTDIHPPLHYIINHFLYSIFHNWPMVRVFSAFLYLCALLFLVSKTERSTHKLFLLVMLGLNPTVLLWCTSIRWYAYAMPLLMLLSVVPDWNRKGYWWYFFGIFLILCYLGYAGFVLALPYFLLYWLRDRNTFATKCKRVLLPALAFAFLYSYQLLIFLKIHTQTQLTPDNEQSFDLKTSVLSFISSAFSNQGVFPLSVAGIVSMIGSTIVFVWSLVYFRKLGENRNWMTFSLSGLLFILSGIAGKVRNLVLLEPSRNLFFADILSADRKRIVSAGLLLVLAGNLAGVYNVLMHEGTTKNVWNIPLQTSLTQLDRMEQKNVQEIYFTHNPTFTYYLTRENKNLVSFYNTLYFDEKDIRTDLSKLAADSTPQRNLTFILTYRGKTIPVEHYAAMLAAMNEVKADSVVRLQMGKDKDYALKKKFFPDYPMYNVEILKFYGVHSSLLKLNAWETAR